MRKTFPLTIEGKNRDRVLDAVKHEIRKYIKRERRRVVPEGADYWDFDCRFGVTQEAAEVVHLSALIGQIDVVAREGGNQASCIRSEVGGVDHVLRALSCVA